MTGTLAALGFHIGDGVVKVPSWRPDVEGGQDLAEEIARVRGMEAIDARIPTRPGIARRDEGMVLAERVRDGFAAAGYTEVLLRTLQAPGVLPDLGLGEAVHRLANPMTVDESVLSPSLVPALLLVAQFNRDRGVERQAFFSIGPVFLGDDAHPSRELEAGAFLTLGPEPGLYGSVERTVHDLVGTAEMLWDWTGLPYKIEPIQPGEDLPAYAHPGRSATIRRGDDIVGVVTELHPSVAEAWRLPRAALLLVRLPDEAPVHVASEVRRPSRYPSIRRDLSVMMPQSTTYAAVSDAIRVAAGRWLTELTPFDRYEGPAGESLTMLLRFQADDRTLTEAEVDQQIDAVMACLGDIGVRLRTG